MNLSSKNNLVWLDLEMTGLKIKYDKIIEIATVITDQHLEVIAYGPDIAIHQTDEVLDGMNEWCTKQHTQSGLVERVKNSKISVKEAEELTLNFIKQYVQENTSPMCGNSICMDRRFLSNYMPKLENYFNYRNLDVSTLKILSKLWCPKVFDKINKKSNHRAKDDILESIEELKLYKKEFLVTEK